MAFFSCIGSAHERGRVYGRHFAQRITDNIRILVKRVDNSPLPHDNPAFVSWYNKQISILQQHWPWLLEEMTGVAEGADVDYHEVQLLNLRAWQYDYYGAPPGTQCSSLAIRLNDGTMACAGALDDPIQYYCGPVHIKPDEGYGFISFPITGTSWGNRGMNERGLSIGISSQLLPGLRRLDMAMNQDLAKRVILQTCATIDEVRKFCQKHPFTMNLVCVDAENNVFCAHQTAAGMIELPVEEGGCALTNHVIDDDIKEHLRSRGVQQFPEAETTRPRRTKLLDFISKRSGQCTPKEVRDFISLCDKDDPGTIHRANKGTCFLTFSNPANDPTAFWVMQPHASDAFEVLKVL